MDLEPELKQDIMEDLQRFSRGKKYYRKVGRAWKWGYFLYDPPGTGKSSMIFAMANFLDYDISDLELTQVKNNTELRKLLIATTKKSIIVIEYIDFSLDLLDRKKKKPQKYDEEDEKPSKPGKPDESKANQDNKVTLGGSNSFCAQRFTTTGSIKNNSFSCSLSFCINPTCSFGQSGIFVRIFHCSKPFIRFTGMRRLDIGVSAYPLLFFMWGVDIHLSAARLCFDVIEGLKDHSSGVHYLTNNTNFCVTIVFHV